MAAHVAPVALPVLRAEGRVAHHEPLEVEARDGSAVQQGGQLWDVVAPVRLPGQVHGPVDILWVRLEQAVHHFVALRSRVIIARCVVSVGGVRKSDASRLLNIKHVGNHIPAVGIWQKM